MADWALLLTDVVDSTRLVQQLGDARAAALWTEHDRRARALLAQCNGLEIDRSDGFLLLFHSAHDAAHYALAYHQTLSGLQLAARAGLHFSPASLRENTPADVARGAKRYEVDGLAKPFAARVMALAGGGQTLLSGPATLALGGLLPPGADVQRHGHYRMKGITEPVQIDELGLRGQAAFVPPSDTDKAYRVVHVNGLWRPARDVPHTLPAERDPFIGRSIELHALSQRLDAGIRLLTVMGAAGTGKTRLVVRYGWSWLGDWPGGICFCDLSEARSLDGVFSAVAVALGVPLGDTDPGLQLGHAIVSRGRCLLVLDNCEQVAEHAATALALWLDRCPDARFLATSRERLRLVGEELFALEPLPLADDAIALFAVRARSHNPQFAVADDNRQSVAEVVRLLDGLPLAIELAAARVRVLSPALLVERMRDRFSLLVGMRGGSARQTTLRAAIDWSWNLLTPWEQAALMHCSVFEGSFTLLAAETVVHLSPWPQAPPALDVLQSLVDKSLLRSRLGESAARPASDGLHFGLYVSIRDYAREQLDGAAGRAAELRHGLHFAQFGAQEAIDALRRHNGTQRLRALAAALDDLVSACRRAVARADAPVAAATYRAAAEVFEQQGPMRTAAALGTDVLALASLDAADRVTVSMRLGIALDQLGATADACNCLEAALALCCQRGLRRLEGAVMAQLGVVNRWRGHGANEKARAALQHALAVARETGDRIGEGTALTALGTAQAELGLVDAAIDSLRAGLEVHRDVGNSREEAVTLGALGARCLDRGDLATARGHFEAALALHRQAGNRRSASTELLNLGALHRSEKRIDEAEACYLEALANDRAVGARAHEAMVLVTLVLAHDARGRAEDALACCEQALAIAREVRRPHFISFALTNLAGLHTQAGRIEQARRALAEAEPIQRGGGPLQLGKFLCVRGVSDHAAGDHAAARAALAEAEAIAQQIGAGPESGLRIALAEALAVIALAPPAADVAAAF